MCDLKDDPARHMCVWYLHVTSVKNDDATGAMTQVLSDLLQILQCLKVLQPCADLPRLSLYSHSSNGPVAKVAPTSPVPHRASQGG